MKDYKLVIQSLDDQTLGIENSMIMFFTGDWKNIAKKEFSEFYPGTKKNIRVWNGEELIYGYKNY